MPNIIAHAILIAWPLVAIALFARLPLDRALIWSLLAGYLLLPEGLSYNAPLIPAWNKSFAPAFTALILCVLNERRDPARAALWRSAGWLPRNPALKLLALLYVLGAVGTVLTNGDPVPVADRTLPALNAYSIGNFVYVQMTALLPFLLARRYLRDETAQRALAGALIAAGVVYALPILIEIRLSPQINNWVYGFYQFNFAQQIRAGGFRPVVFLNHGLWTAIFTATALTVAAGYARLSEGRDRTRALGATAFLFAVLALSNSLTALLLATLFVMLSLTTPLRVQKAVLLGVAGIVLFYPLLRSAGLIPTDDLVALARAINEQRANSLQFRFDNEDMLIARAKERALFGWGAYGRNLIYDDFGRLVTITDGQWIISFGKLGWVGYAAEFGLLAAPLVFAMMRPGLPSAATIALCLALCVNLLDMLPNASLTPLTWLIAGAALGRLEQREGHEDAVASRPPRKPAVTPPPRPVIGALTPRAGPSAR